MSFKTIRFIIISLVITLTVPDLCFAAQKIIKLPEPDTKGGIPLMAAISKRESSRSFSDKALSHQSLSDILWAAFGINRKDSGKRTAPSSMNKQEISVYAVLKEGVFLYNPEKHQLEQVSDKDIRVLTGRQGYVKNAPLNLVYVADMNRVAGGSSEDKILYAGADTGFIGENVYLYCASAGLATVIRASIDIDALAVAMKLKPYEKIILSQTVGYPGK